MFYPSMAVDKTNTRAGGTTPRPTARSVTADQCGSGAAVLVTYQEAAQNEMLHEDDCTTCLGNVTGSGADKSLAPPQENP
jgi:hypothetical protein